MNDRFTRRELCSGRSLLSLMRHTVASVQQAVSQVQQAVSPPAPPARPAPPRSIPVLRPPHAVSEAEFLAGCTRCGDCATACPHGAIIDAPIRLTALRGTPVINPASAPCHLCPDTPCVSACEPRVLDRRLPLKIGLARIIDHACLGVRGQGCSACVERCPVPGALRLEAGRPVVDPEVCNGCGICAHVCPAPQAAILIIPERERPAAPAPTEAA